MQKLLLYLLDRAQDGQVGDLKETVIGVEVFGRETGYDPKIDGIVRTEARRLRLKLQEYYGATGQHETVRIELPKGGYLPVVRETPPAVGVDGRPKRAWPTIAAGCVLGAAILGILIARNPVNTIPSVPRKFTTSSGNARSPVFSPDGTRLAYSLDDRSTSRILVAPQSGGPAVAWTDGRSPDYEPAWSPDGKRLAFLRGLPSRRYELRIAAGPGESSLLGEISGRDAVDWSPDGQFIAVADQVAPDAPKSIFLVDVRKGARQQITTPPVGTLGDGRPRFSPDGLRLAFVRAVAEGAEDVHLLQLSPENSRAPRPITAERRAIGTFAWMPSGEELLISVSRPGMARSLWRTRISDSSMRRVAEAGIGPLTPTAARKGARIAWATVTQDTNIWKLALDGSEPDRPVADSSAADTSPRVSPDGRWLAFRSARTGFDEIWISGVDGDHPRQLTSMKGPITGSPRWSPDGQYVLFDSRPSGNASIYRIPAAGGDAVRLTPDTSNQTCPSWSRDGRFVYFASDRAGRSQVFRLPSGGGAQEPITREGGGASFESSDGEYLYYTRGPQQPGLWRVALRRAGAAEEPVIAGLDKALWGNWAVASAGVYFVRRNPAAAASGWQIAFQNFATGQVNVIRELPHQPVLWDNGLALSPDEKTLFYTTLDTSSSDIYVLDGIR